MSDAILVLNAGSSSIKFSLFPGHEQPTRQDIICDGECEGIGQRSISRQRTVRAASSSTSIGRMAKPMRTRSRICFAGSNEAFPQVRLIAAGHRVVHGGSLYTGPVRIDESVVAELRRLIPLAPLHQPHHLAAIAALSKLHPSLPQIACFDTSFHHTQPEVASIFALPRNLTEEGIRRYGFHGLSYEYIASVLPDVMGPAAAETRVVVAHLGNGASMCAMLNRKSVATTMGFTALDGLPMGQRCGNLDPGVVLYLMEEKGMTVAGDQRSALPCLGIAWGLGISNDMRTLLASDNAHAREAVDLFVYRICRELGSLAAALSGLDVLVFTAGIGEHATEIRRRVCEQAAWFGFEIDEVANAAGGPRITAGGGKVSAWVIPTDEDLMIARHCWALLLPQPSA